MSNEIQFFAVDWGTTNVRVWGVDRAGSVAFSTNSEMGMSRFIKEDYEKVLLELISSALPSIKVPVLICGMAGAKSGWSEANYRSLPCRLTEFDGSVGVQTTSDRIDVRILAGVRQSDPEDVMRGEETQVAGFLAMVPDFEGIICCPGTHSKWICVSDQSIQEFQTFMTCELFDLLRTHSVLKDAVQTAGVQSNSRRLDLFSEIDSRDLAQSLFQIRAGQLLNGTPPKVGCERLSALLIQAEARAALETFQPSEVTLLGSDKLMLRYASVLRALGVRTNTIDATAATVAGLVAGRSAIENSNK